MGFVVTGGKGFIGENLVKKLVSQGEHVKVIDIKTDGTEIDGVEYYYNDIRDFQKITEIIQDDDIVIHLAAIMGSFDEEVEFQEAIDINTLGTKNILEASKENNAKKFILASSAAVYGNHSKMVNEYSETKPLSFYGFTKLAAEAFTDVYAYQRNLPSIVLRFFNVYGPGMHFNEHPISFIARCIYSVKQKFNIPLFGGGTQTRDFIYVDDVVDAIICAIGYDFEKEAETSFTTLNIGTGNSCMIKTVAEKIANIMDEPFNASGFVIREFDIKKSCADTRAAYVTMRFRSLISIDDGLRKTIKWFEANEILKEA